MMLREPDLGMCRRRMAMSTKECMARQDLLGKHGQQEEEKEMPKKLTVVETAAREVEWRRHIAAWEEGELSQRDYCA